ncbi:MAG: class I SAM-dependent methyltransferase [Desulfococcaceae bacterium]|jgi:ubiquinone/menaquinone biosynthesis C-methylase UbiE|nr:class I SAM-dependent methyltransferase [Desulfococcaceae bacterium]
MNEKKFDPKKLQKLNHPERLKDIPPDYICGKLHMENPEVLVEIGAGTAFFSKAFLAELKAGKIYACDVSEAMLNWMKDNISPGHPDIIPVRSEENAVPLDDEIADLVFMINLHHELDSPSVILAESYRMIKPGGKIFIADWKKEDMPQGPPPEIRCSPEEVREQLIKTGFHNVHLYNELQKHFLIVGQK